MAKKEAPAYCCWISEKLYARINYKEIQPDNSVKWRQATRLVQDEDGNYSESPKDAARIVRELQNEYDQHRGEGFKKDKSSVNSLLDDWLSYIKPGIRKRTYDDYESKLRLYVRPVIGRHLVAEVEDKHIQVVVNKMSDKGLSARSVGFVHTILFMAFKYAVRPKKLLKENPVQYVTVPQGKQREYVWLSQETREKFLDTCDADPNGLLLEFALVTGMRLEEYLALRWKDVNLQRATATVERVVVFRRTKRQTQDGEPPFWFEEPKTKKSRRTITLPHYLTQKLSQEKLRQKEESLGQGIPWSEDNLVFPSGSGTPIKPWNLNRRIFKPILVKAGLPDMRLYDLRHSFATHLHDLGASIKDISEFLGHTSTRQAENIYIHVDEERMRQHTNKLERKSC
ncbi:MAG: tyrosine-type recombinase/integrase [Blastocatellia bacterium]